MSLRSSVLNARSLRTHSPGVLLLLDRVWPPPRARRAPWSSGRAPLVPLEPTGVDRLAYFPFGASFSYIFQIVDSVRAQLATVILQEELHRKVDVPERRAQVVRDGMGERFESFARGGELPFLTRLKRFLPLSTRAPVVEETIAPSVRSSSVSGAKVYSTWSDEKAGWPRGLRLLAHRSWRGARSNNGEVLTILYCDNAKSGKKLGRPRGLELMLAQAGMALENALLQRKLKTLSGGRPVEDVPV